MIWCAQALAGGARGVVVADGRRTEFWVAEEGSDRIAMRQELEIENSPAMESVLSLRTVEFLRVSLGLVGRARHAARRRAAASSPKPAEVGARVALGVIVGRRREHGPPGAVRGRERRPARAHRRSGGHRAARAGAVRRPSSWRGRTGPIDTSVWLAGGGLVLAPRTAARVAFEHRRGRAGRDRVRQLARNGRQSRDARPHGRARASTGAPPAASASAPSWSVRLDVLGGSTAPAAPIIAITDACQGRHHLGRRDSCRALAGVRAGDI